MNAAPESEVGRRSRDRHRKPCEISESWSNP
jgi:hypothetical protein